jgi:hypothetical protein
MDLRIDWRAAFKQIIVNVRSAVASLVLRPQLDFHLDVHHCFPTSVEYDIQRATLCSTDPHKFHFYIQRTKIPGKNDDDRLVRMIECCMNACRFRLAGAQDTESYLVLTFVYSTSPQPCRCIDYY